MPVSSSSHAFCITCLCQLCDIPLSRDILVSHLMACSPHSHLAQGRGAKEGKGMQRKSEATRTRANQRAIEGERETRRRKEGWSERLRAGKRERATSMRVCYLHKTHTHIHISFRITYTRTSPKIQKRGCNLPRTPLIAGPTAMPVFSYVVSLHFAFTSSLSISRLPHPSTLTSKPSTLNPQPADPMPVFLYSRSMHFPYLS